jgi:hypothetical protein
MKEIRHSARTELRRRISLVAVIMLLAGTLSGCIDFDWKINLNRDGSGTAELKFINDSLPTTNFKRDFEKRNNWIKKLYTMGARSETGSEAGREFILYRVSFKNLSDLSDSDLRFAYAEVDNGKNYEFSLTPKPLDPLTPPMRFHMEVKMPGKIVDSNATNTIEDEVAVWDGTLNAFSREGPLYAKSEASLLSAILPANLGMNEILAGVGVALLILLGIGVWLVQSRRQSARPPAPAVQAQWPGPQPPAAHVEQAVIQRRCPQCNEQASPTARFCKNCGTPLAT